MTDTQTSTINHPIDENGYFHLELNHDPKSNTLSGKIVAPDWTLKSFLENFSCITTIEIVGQPHPIHITPQPDGSYGFSHALKEDSAALDIVMGTQNRQIFGHYTVDKEDGLSGDAVHKLVVFETRMLGRYAEPVLPYPRIDIPEELHPKTDLHSHLTAQVSSKDLIAIGLAKEGGSTRYPTALLDEIGIDYSYVPAEQIETIKHMVFIPTMHLPQPETETAVPLDALSPQALRQLEDSLHFKPDRQSIYPDMELNMYRLREPMTKDIALLPAMIECIAEDYAKNGVAYAELQITSVVKPEWFQIVHEVMPGIEERTGVELRFIQQIPRTLYDEQMEDYIEKSKLIADSPYFAGINFVGYELNKTSDLKEHIHNFASAMHDKQSKDVFGFHVGETSKNIDNLREFLDIMHQYTIHTRLGHLLHGVNESTLALAQEHAGEGLLIAEAIPDSNMALNNIDVASDLSLKKLLESGVPCTLNTDGGGAYLTTPKQLAQVAVFAGATLDDLRTMRTTEDNYITWQKEEFIRKQAAFPKDFFEQLENALPPAHYTPEVAAQKKAEAEAKIESLHKRLDNNAIIHDPSAIETTTAGIAPLLLAGATGNNWLKIEAEDRKEINIGVRMLESALDVSKNSFFTGRPKNEGIVHVVNQAITQADRTATGEKRLFEGFVVEAKKALGKSVNIDALTHMHLAEGNALTLFEDMIGEIKNRNGIALFVGVGDFTRNLIEVAIRNHVPVGLMKGPAGAANDKANHRDERFSFEGAKGMVEKVHELKPEWFVKEFERSQLDERYEAAFKQILRGTDIARGSSR